MIKYDEIIKSYEESPFNKYIGFEVLQLDDEGVRLKLSVKEHHLNMSNILHGGVYATMLDVVSGMAIAAVTGKPTVTISLNINYLAPAESNTNIIAEAQIIQQGYKLMTVDAKVLDSNEKMITKAVGTFKVLRDS